jgi:DNA repair protein RecO (recombination protein O)
MGEKPGRQVQVRWFVIDRATGIILRTYPLTETSLIVHWLTAEHGRIATAAKGARRPKSPFRGALDLFYFASFTFQRSRRSDLHALREVTLAHTFDSLRRNLASLAQATYFAALIEQTSETDTPIPELFDLFHSVLQHLQAEPPSVQTVFAFELKLLRQSGLAPTEQLENAKPASRKMLTHLQEANWIELRLSAADLQDIQKFLHHFLLYHLGKIPASRAAALST